MGKSTVQKATVQIDVIGQAQDFENTVKQVQASLNKLGLSKSLSSEFTSLFDRLSEKMTEYKRLTKDGMIDAKGLKEANKLMESMTSHFDKIITKMNKADLDTTVLAKDLQAYNALQTILTNYNKKLTETEKNQERLNNITSKIAEGKADLAPKIQRLEEYRKETEKAKKVVEELAEAAEDLGIQTNTDHRINQAKFNEIKQKKAKAEESLAALKSSDIAAADPSKELANGREAAIEVVRKAFSQYRFKGREGFSKKSSDVQTEEIKAFLQQLIESDEEPEIKGSLSGIKDYITAHRQAIATEEANIADADTKIDAIKTYTENIDGAIKTQDDWNQKVRATNTSIEKLKSKITELQDTQNTLTNLTQKGVSLKDIMSEIDLSALEDIGISKDSINSIQDLKEIISNLTDKAQAELSNANKLAEEGQGTLKKMGDAGKTANDTLDDVLDKRADIDRLKNSIREFFSITNTVQIFRRAIQSAINTVKELDAAMQEIAVVTDYSISDMWGELDQFTAIANELGSSITEVYEATTLFTQQGVDLETSIGMASETLKMAAIAGMNAADATDAVTAAIHGFNMEIDQASAQHILDVYSNLASLSASNTQEISNAMTKTASIAASANMSFENTAAFLAQIIETTREGSETAGTALMFSA